LFVFWARIFTQPLRIRYGNFKLMRYDENVNRNEPEAAHKKLPVHQKIFKQIDTRSD